MCCLSSLCLFHLRTLFNKHPRSPTCFLNKQWFKKTKKNSHFSLCSIRGSSINPLTFVQTRIPRQSLLLPPFALIFPTSKSLNGSFSDLVVYVTLMPSDTFVHRLFIINNYAKKLRSQPSKRNPILVCKWLRSPWSAAIRCVLINSLMMSDRQRDWRCAGQPPPQTLVKTPPPPPNARVSLDAWWERGWNSVKCHCGCCEPINNQREGSEGGWCEEICLVIEGFAFSVQPDVCSRAAMCC